MRNAADARFHRFMLSTEIPRKKREGAPRAPGKVIVRDDRPSGIYFIALVLYGVALLVFLAIEFKQINLRIPWFQHQGSGPLEELGFSLAFLAAGLGLCTFREWNRLRQQVDKQTRIVEERTAELLRANEVLRAEAQVRERTEAALRESEEQFRQLAETIEEVFWVTNPEKTRMIYVSPGYEKIWGRSCGELYRSPRSWVDSIHPEDREGVLKAALNQQTSGGYDEEYRVVRPDGEVRWVRDRAFPLKNSHGKVLRIIGTATDITARKQSERRLEGAYNFKRAILEASPLGILVYDPSGRMLSANRAAVRMIGGTAEELSAQNLRELASWKRSGLLAAAEEALQTGGEKEIEIQLVSTFGKDLWIISRFVPYVHEEQVHLLVIFTDIADRKKAEEERARLAEEIDLLLSSTDQGIYGIDLEGVCTRINRAAAEMVGRDPGEIVGRQMHELLHHHHQNGREYPWEGCPIHEVLKTGRPARNNSEVFWRLDGTQFPVEYSASPILKNGTIRGAVVAFTDRTESRRLQQQLQQSQKMEAIGCLAGGVAHDFNNILSVIMMQTQVLQLAEPLNDEFREGLKEIMSGAERAAHLTRQLLLFSRKEVMRLGKVDLNQVVTNLGKMLRRIIGEDVHLEIKLESGLLPVRADAGMLDQILLNLAVNARDAMPSGGRLVIETAKSPHSARSDKPTAEQGPTRFAVLRVKDSGCGIAPEILPHIFEPFFTTKEVGKGTGLGLATVFGIVKQHGGSISVQSPPGAGAQFEIMLPLIGDPAGENAAAPPKLAGGKETLLLVEDDHALRYAMRIMLQRQGYSVIEAANGPEGIRKWEENQNGIALAITDMVMPGGMSGSELAAQLQARKPGLSVILLSGYSDALAGREILLAPGQAFLQKPATSAALLQQIRLFLDAA